MRPRSRRSELDGLRGLAVLLMLGQHLMVWLWNHDSSSPLALPLTIISAAGGLAAPLFVTLAGCGSALGYRASPTASTRSIVRGITLLTMAYILSLATPSWFTLRSFYVLHLLAVGLLVAPLLAKRSQTTLFALAVATAAATALLQSQFALPLSIANPYMSARPLTPGLSAALIDSSSRATLAGHFPLFPWLMPLIMGMAAGQRLNNQERLPLYFGLLPLLIGAAGLSLGLLGVFPATPQNPLYRLVAPHVPFFPCSPALCLTLCGISLLAITIVQHYPKLTTALVPAGRVSLTVLMIHLPLFRELSRPVNAWRNLSGLWTLVVIATVMVFCILLAKKWKNADYRYGAEWLLRQSDRLLTR